MLLFGLLDMSLSYSTSHARMRSVDLLELSKINPSLDRRSSFGTVSNHVSYLLGVSSLSFTQPCLAAENSGEAIRQTMSGVPGYGPSDIFYPEYFDGKWKVRRSKFSEGDSSESKVLEYEVRFVRKEIGVVADRGFNEASRVAAETSDEKLVRETKWDVTNPNVLNLLFKDGTSKEVRVTKRSSDVSGDLSSSDNWLLQSSEFARVSEVGPNGIPELSIIHTLSKWKPGANKNIVEGIELAFNEGNLGDPMAFSLQPNGSGKVKIKSRVQMERLM